MSLGGNLKFKLSTLLLISALVAALLGWHFERRHYRLEYEAHVEAAEMTATIVNSTRGKITLFRGIGRHESGEITTQELRDFSRSQLWFTVSNLYHICQQLPDSSSILDTPSYQKCNWIRTRRLFGLLGISDIDDLKNLLVAEPSVFRSRDSLINLKGKFEPEFLIFAEHALSDPSTYYQ